MNKWHPYPEEKPKEFGVYIVTVRWNGKLIVDSDYYYPHGFENYDGSILAWAELPKPYEPKE